MSTAERRAIEKVWSALHKNNQAKGDDERAEAKEDYRDAEKRLTDVRRNDR